MIANAAGFVTGTLNAYYWNSKFVFKKEAKKSGKKERITGKNIYFVWDEFFAQFFVALYTGQFPWNIADNCSYYKCYDYNTY